MRTLNLCLDLNIWCAAFLADRKSMNGSSSQVLVRYARSGRIGEVPVQLIISWAMLTRLRKVLEVDWGVSRETVDPVIETIAGYAHMGASGISPHIVLGGTGLMPIRDEEDGHVLDTAIAGQAHLLVTANFDDFISAKSKILEPRKVGIVTTANATLVVAHPYRAVSWMQQNMFPDAETVSRLFA